VTCMNDDIFSQLVTLVAITLGIVLPLIFKSYLKRLRVVSFISIILGLLSFMLLVIIQTRSEMAIYILYGSLGLWIFGLTLMIQISIQSRRRLK
jgi:hypothetical protein